MNENKTVNIVKGLGIAVAVIGCIIGIILSFAKVEYKDVFVWSIFLPYLLQSLIGGSIVFAIGCAIGAIYETFNKFTKVVIPETLKKISDK